LQHLETRYWATALSAAQFALLYREALRSAMNRKPDGLAPHGAGFRQLKREMKFATRHHTPVSYW